MALLENSEAAKWAAIETRDREADGTFYYSVKTTGVYCKPSCSARALRKNVAFHATRGEAERAGFRPCKRCKPEVAVPEIGFTIAKSALGLVAIAASGKGVCAVLFGDDANELRRELGKRFPKARLVKDGNGIAAMSIKVLSILANPKRKTSFALDANGTAFQCKVWDALKGIPAGTTASYAEIAKTIGMPKSSRAVAQACGANPVAVAIPCHRVVRSDGSLSGYRWGAERKRALLARETA
jgi:AraC family transcriptional regulator of adaptative response/methylated-DNA-[protein]-cysteine methyltransferase